MNSRMRASLFGFLLLFTLACKDNEREKQQDKQEVQEADVPIEDPLTELDKSADTEPWEDFHREQFPFLKMEEFIEVSQFKPDLLSQNMSLDEDFYKKYGKIISYSPDSSAFADIYSYSLIIEEEKGDLVARRGEPDKEVAVVDLKSGKRTRLLFCGTSCTFEQATWLNKKTMAVLGLTDDDGDEIFRPAVWVIHTPSGQIKQYKYPDQINRITPGSFTKAYLAKKGIKYGG